MNRGVVRRVAGALCLSSLQIESAGAAQPAQDNADLRAYVDDTCIIADEPYFLPVNKDAADQTTAKFLPLLGLVVGKLAELFINHGTTLP